MESAGPTHTTHRGSIAASVALKQHFHFDLLRSASRPGALLILWNLPGI
jgi:hypothetical protein